MHGLCQEGLKLKHSSKTKGKLNCRENMDYKLLTQAASIHSNYATKPSLTSCTVLWLCKSSLYMWFPWETDCDLVLLQRKINIIKLKPKVTSPPWTVRPFLLFPPPPSNCMKRRIKNERLTFMTFRKNGQLQ